MYVTSVWKTEVKSTDLIALSLYHPFMFDNALFLLYK